MLARNAIEVLGEKEDRFRIGYHAQPSMKPLHLHVVSKDFFIDATRIREELQEDGLVAQWSEATLKRLLGEDLECCGETFSNMPKLKEHIHKGHG